VADGRYFHAAGGHEARELHRVIGIEILERIEVANRERYQDRPLRL